jgi:predicted transcriptional regulator
MITMEKKQPRVTDNLFELSINSKDGIVSIYVEEDVYTEGENLKGLMQTVHAALEEFYRQWVEEGFYPPKDTVLDNRTDNTLTNYTEIKYTIF